MGKIQHINGLEWTRAELVSLNWNVNGIDGRVIIAKTPRAADLLARHIGGDPQTVVFGLAFGTDEAYYTFCEHSDAEGIPREDE